MLVWYAHCTLSHFLYFYFLRLRFYPWPLGCSIGGYFIVYLLVLVSSEFTVFPEVPVILVLSESLLFCRVLWYSYVCYSLFGICYFRYFYVGMFSIHYFRYSDISCTLFSICYSRYFYVSLSSSRYFWYSYVCCSLFVICYFRYFYVGLFSIHYVQYSYFSCSCYWICYAREVGYSCFRLYFRLFRFYIFDKELMVLFMFVILGLLTNFKLTVSLILEKTIFEYQTRIIINNLFFLSNKYILRFSKIKILTKLDFSLYALLIYCKLTSLGFFGSKKPKWSHSPRRVYLWTTVKKSDVSLYVLCTYYKVSILGFLEYKKLNQSYTVLYVYWWMKFQKLDFSFFYVYLWMKFQKLDFSLYALSEYYKIINLTFFENTKLKRFYFSMYVYLWTKIQKSDFMWYVSLCCLYEYELTKKLKRRDFSWYVSLYELEINHFTCLSYFNYMKHKKINVFLHVSLCVIELNKMLNLCFFKYKKCIILYFSEILFKFNQLITRCCFIYKKPITLPNNIFVSAPVTNITRKSNSSCRLTVKFKSNILYKDTIIVKCSGKLSVKNVIQRILRMHGINNNTNFYCFQSMNLLLSNYMLIADIIGFNTNNAEITVCFDNTFGGGKRSYSGIDSDLEKAPNTYTYENKPKLLRRAQNVETLSCSEKDDTQLQTDSSDDVLLSSNKSISLLFSNVRGLRAKDKIIALRHVSKEDSIICLNETNYTVKDKPKVIEDELGKAVEIASMNNYCFNKSGALILSEDRDDIVGKNYRGRKKKNSGYGTCIISKDENLVDFLEKNDKFEIIISRLKYKNIKGLLVTVYRSPTMRDKASNDNLFNTIKTLIRKYGGYKFNDFIIYIGDDNIFKEDTSHKYLSNLQESLCVEFLMVDMIEGQMTRGNRQPDSCLAYFDMAKISIEAEVIGKIHKKMDHDAIRINISFKGIIPEFISFNNFVRRRVINMSDDKVQKMLNQKFETWNEEYEHLSEATNFDENLIEEAMTKFHNIISEVKQKQSKIIISRLANGISDELRASQVKEATEYKRLQDIVAKIRVDPTNLELRKRMLEMRKRVDNRRAVVTAEDINRDIKYQEKNLVVSSKRLFELSDRLLSKDGLKDKLQSKLSDTEKQERLKANNETYNNSDIKIDLDEYKTIIPENYYEIDLKPDQVAEIVRNIDKIDKFFKLHIDVLKVPILIMCKLIARAGYCPKELKKSRCTILPSRVIYSLSAIPKIFDKIFSLAFEKCLRKDYIENGDPLQMAYEPARGTESANAISLSEIEYSVKIKNEAALQVYIDLKKAFNRANRQVIINESQRIAGAGSIMKSWFNDRTSIFENKESIFESNCGVLPGTSIGVVGFKLFINQDLSLTGKNNELLWACAYSDDRSPVVGAKYVNAGSFQDTIDESFRFAEKMDVNII